VERYEEIRAAGEGVRTESREEPMRGDAREDGASGARGDEFIAQLSHSHGPHLLEYLARMLGQIEVAREVAQDAYKEVQRLYRAEDVMFPRTMLYKIATDFALMRLRRGKSEASNITTSAAMASVPTRATPLDKRVMAEESNQKLVQSIKGLRRGLRDVLIMAHIQGIARKDIADQMGISLKQVDKRITKALRILRERMDSLGIDSLRVG
jgi:RNA polymerase sigma factor (sigma-70 family)